MGARKIPEDAFAFYVAMGSARSYAAVAKKFRVTKRGVVRCAARERWQERLVSVEHKARDVVETKMAGEIAAIHLRHGALLHTLGTRVADALKEFPLRSGMEAARALEVVVRLERLLVGQAGENRAVMVGRVSDYLEDHARMHWQPIAAREVKP